MNDRWQLRVEDARSVHVAELSGAAEVGRQQSKDEKQPTHYRIKDGWRVVIAPLEEITVSRKHLEIKPQPDGSFVLGNKSANQVIGLPSNQELMPGATCKLPGPIALRLGNKTIRISQLEESADEIESLPMATMAPGSQSMFASMQASFARTKGSAMDSDQLMGWIQAFLGLLHSAAGSEDFYVKAAKAVVDLVKLDSGRVLFRVGDKWEAKAVHTTDSAAGRGAAEWRPSSRVLSGVLNEKKTFWQVPDARAGASTSGIDAVVAAPILNRRGEVIGALYGERRQAVSLAQGMRPLSMLEASLVEVLAGGVAAGLARVDQEQMALRARLQMEQFFGPGLAAELADHPEMLVGRDMSVSVLFCDIRAFSRISEKLGPAKTVEWIADVMGELSRKVLDHEGVVVDYIGDELMAMWGAPKDQPDHPARACRTALAMFECLPKLNDRWQAILGEPLNLGIGVNSGIAQVGNVGSSIKFKYGALGNTVNLASRVQGATKHLKARLLITEATQGCLDSTFATRRLCQVRVVNIAKPVTLFELVEPGNAKSGILKQGYEEALDAFSKGSFRQACHILGRLILDHPNDGPTLLLLSRAVACLVEEPESFDPVMVLQGK